MFTAFLNKRENLFIIGISLCLVGTFILLYVFFIYTMSVIWMSVREKLSILHKQIRSGETNNMLSSIWSINKALFRHLKGLLVFNVLHVLICIWNVWNVSKLFQHRSPTKLDGESIDSISKTVELLDHSNTYNYTVSFNGHFQFPPTSWVPDVFCVIVGFWALFIVVVLPIQLSLLFCELQDLDTAISKLQLRYPQQVNGVCPQQLAASVALRQNGLQSLLRRCQRSVYADRWLIASVLLVFIYLSCAADYAEEDEFAFYVKWYMVVRLIHAIMSFFIIKLRRLSNLAKKLKCADVLKVFIAVQIVLILTVGPLIYNLYINIWEEMMHPRRNLIILNRRQDISIVSLDYFGLQTTKVFSNFVRFNTEDVRFVCDFQAYVNDKAENVKVEFEWYLDNKPFKRTSTRTNSSTGFVVGPQTWNDASHKRRLFYGKQDLLLLRLTDSDYGNYSCFCNIAQWFSSHTEHIKMHFPRHVVSTFTLAKLAAREEIHFLSVGEPVQLGYLINAEDNEEGSLLVERQVNGKSIEELTHRGSKCFIISFDKFGGNYPQNHQYYLRYPMVLDIYTACLGYEALGLHTATVRRVFYNHRTKTEDFVEAEYPFAVRLDPATRFDPITGNFIDNGDDEFAKCLNKGAIYSNSDWWCSIKMSSTNWQYFKNEIYNVSWGLVFLSSPLLFIWYLLWISTALISLLFAGSLNPPEVLTIHDTAMTHDFNVRERQPDNLRPFDVFLTYSSKDRSTAKRVRDILLAHRMTVFDSHRDVALGAQPLSAWNHAMTQSRSFVLIVSAAYNANPELGELQFRCLYDCVVHGDVEEDRMLLLTTQPGLVSRHLLSLPVIDLTHQHSRRQLQAWITISLRSPGGRSLRQLCRDVASDMQHLTVRYPPLAEPSGQHEQTLEHGQEPGRKVLGAGVHTTPLHENACCKVFLSYCEDSLTDRQLAMKLKPVLCSKRLEVFDSVEDAVPGQDDLQLTASAAGCQAYVIIMSASYRRDPLTRRLHLPQLLHDLETGRVSPDDVLIVSAMTVDGSAGVNRPGHDSDWTSPEWFQAFTKIDWTGNVTEDDHLRRVRRWAYQRSRRWNRQNQHDLAHLRQQFLQVRARHLHRPFHLPSFFVRSFM